MVGQFGEIIFHIINKPKMDKNEFLEQMERIAQAHTKLIAGEERFHVANVQRHLRDDINALLDLAFKYLPEKGEI